MKRKEKLGITCLQCCNYRHKLCDFSSRFHSSSMAILHHKSVRMQDYILNFGQWVNWIGSLDDIFVHWLLRSVVRKVTKVAKSTIWPYVQCFIIGLGDSQTRFRDYTCSWVPLTHLIGLCLSYTNYGVKYFFQLLVWWRCCKLSMVGETMSTTLSGTASWTSKISLKNPRHSLNPFSSDTVQSRGGHSIVKFNTTCEQSLLPLYYMP